MGRKGLAPPNKKAGRNALVVAALEGGMKNDHVAECFEISRQRVTQIWQRYGDGDNLRIRRTRERREGKHG